jgi:hypothetical protein
MNDGRPRSERIIEGIRVAVAVVTFIVMIVLIVVTL